MQEPLVSDFGYRAQTPAREQVTNGTYQPPPGTNPHAAELIRGLKAPDVAAGNKPRFTPGQGISTEDHVRAWKKAKEKTAGGKSGLRFGMFKAHINGCFCAVHSTFHRLLLPPMESGPGFSTDEEEELGRRRIIELKSKGPSS